jgi:hypothetical protein
MGQMLVAVRKQGWRRRQGWPHLHGGSSVDGEELSVDPGCLGSGEERGDCSDVVGGSQAAGGRRRRELVKDAGLDVNALSSPRNPAAIGPTMALDHSDYDERFV